MIRTVLVQGGVVAAACVTEKPLKAQALRSWLVGPNADAAAPLPPGEIVKLDGEAALAPIGAGWLHEAGQFRPPAINAVAVINAHVEAVARGMGYNDAVSCASYIADPNPKFSAEARAFVAWRSAVWSLVIARKDETPPATEAEVIALLPAWEPPQG